MAGSHREEPQEASLLGVAPEIRLRIFNYVLAGSKILVILGPHYLSEAEWPVDKDTASYAKAITQVNSVLRREALDLLNASTTLCLRCITLWNQDELYLDNLLRDLLGRGILERVKNIFVTHCLLDSLPLEKLTSLRRVVLGWRIFTDEEKLLEDNNFVDAALKDLILDQVGLEVSEGRMGRALNEFRRKLAQQSRSIQCIWKVMFSPKTSCERGRYALVDLDTHDVLYSRTMLDSQYDRRDHDGELYLEESTANNTATRDHSCDWCVTNLRRKRQARLNIELSSTMIGNGLAAEI